VSLADDVERALNNASPMRETVGGHSFPGTGRHPDDQIHRLELAVASLGRAVKLIADRLDKLERGRPS